MGLTAQIKDGWDNGKRYDWITNGMRATFLLVAVVIAGTYMFSTFTRDDTAITDEPFLGITVYQFEILPPVIASDTSITIIRNYCNTTGRNVALLNQQAVLNPIADPNDPDSPITGAIATLGPPINGEVLPGGFGCGDVTCEDDDPTKGSTSSATCPEVFPIGPFQEPVLPGWYTLNITAIAVDPQSDRTDPLSAVTQPFQVTG